MKLTFDENVQLILEAASDEVLYQKHTKLSPYHVFYVLIHQPGIRIIFDMMDINVERMKKRLTEHLSSFAQHSYSTQKEVRNFIPPSPEYKKFIEICFISCAKDGRNILSIKDLLVALVQIEDIQNTSFFKEQNISVGDMLTILKQKEFIKQFLDIDVDVPSDKKVQLSFSGEIDEEFSILNVPEDEDSFEEKEEEKTLQKYTVDITSLASDNKLEPFIGQQPCMDEVTEVLLRRQKNNVLLVGDAGVGKTSLVYELANLIYKQALPKELNNIQVLALNITSLVAGTRYRGDFEDRVKSLMLSFIKDKQYILLLDDMYQAMNAGASAGSGNDFGDLIKPLLANNEMRCIGTCTFEELKRIELEKGVLRRFHIVEMKEPSDKETKQILLKLRKRFETFYGVRYSNDVFDTIINLSKKYITDRAFPDKAIDVLDAIGSSIRLKNHVNPKEKIQLVCKEDVETVMSKITKRALNSIKRNELHGLLSLHTKLKKTIFGQDKAIDSFSKIIARSKAGLGDEQKPLASFLLVGPTGVGKTELCKQVALELGIFFHRFDMSEFQEQSAVAKFIGSPPGYVGHANGGLLIDCIRRHPYSLLLLDEIEKAHSDIYNLLLQIMDYATITDSTGRKADFRNVFVCMTSNAGAQSSIQAEIGFESEEHRGGSAMLDAISKVFSPEFRNRLDEVIIFHSLDKQHINCIVTRELEMLRLKLRKLHIEFDWDESLILHIAQKGFSPVFGARNIQRVMKTDVHDLLTNIVLRKIMNSKIKNKSLRTVPHVTLTIHNRQIHTLVKRKRSIV